MEELEGLLEDIKDEREYKCLQCRDVFQSSSHLIQHTLTHVGIRVYMCEICKKLFYTKELLDQHSTTHATSNSAHPTTILTHPTGVIVYPSDIADPISTLSHTTGVVLSTYTIAQPTTNIAHLTPTSSCPTATDKAHPTTAKTSPNKCLERTFVNTPSKKGREKASAGNGRERKLVALLQPKVSPRMKKIVCGECGKLISKCYMKTHLLIHADIRKHECKICKKKFTHKSTLQNHNSIHTGKKFECLECGKAFTRKSYLTFHTKIHLDEAYRNSIDDPL